MFGGVMGVELDEDALALDQLEYLLRYHRGESRRIAPTDPVEMGRIARRQARVIFLRWFKGYTWKELGREFGVSPGRTRQIATQGLRALSIEGTAEFFEFPFACNPPKAEFNYPIFDALWHGCTEGKERRLASQLNDITWIPFHFTAAWFKVRRLMWDNDWNIEKRSKGGYTAPLRRDHAY